MATSYKGFLPDTWTVFYNKCKQLFPFLKKQFVGTKATWKALTSEQQAKYDIVNLTDDNGEGLVVTDTATAGDMNPITSNAVYNLTTNKGNVIYRSSIQDDLNLTALGTYTVKELIDLIYAKYGDCYYIGSLLWNNSRAITIQGTNMSVLCQLGIIQIEVKNLNTTEWTMCQGQLTIGGGNSASEVYLINGGVASSVVRNYITKVI